MDQYKKTLGDKDYSWWSVAPDLAATTFKSFVPFIGIRKWDGATSQMKFGYPDRTAPLTEQFSGLKASYLPNVEFQNAIEVGFNRMYKASDEALSSYGDLAVENQVATGRYVAATAWTLTAGAFFKSFVWATMQGLTCMVPNTSWFMNVGKQAGNGWYIRSLRWATGATPRQVGYHAASFATGVGLSYGYSSLTSKWFFKMRNGTLHKMDLYTESEILKGTSVEEMIGRENPIDPTGSEIDPKAKVELLKIKAVVEPGSNDPEIPIELEWAPTGDEGTAPLPIPPPW
jgi:hypothetical protein